MNDALLLGNSICKLSAKITPNHNHFLSVLCTTNSDFWIIVHGIKSTEEF